MERYALLHRIQHSRQLSRRMTPRPSLLTYVTGHNPLPTTLNPRSSASAKQKDDGRPQGSSPHTILTDDGRLQGSSPHTTPANRRFAAHDTASDDDSADMVGAGVADDGGWGPLRSPVVSHGEKPEPSQSPIVAQNDDGVGHERLQLPTTSQTLDAENKDEQIQHPALPTPAVHDNGQSQESTHANVEQDGRTHATMFDDGRPQGSSPHTTPPPPLPYDAPPANRRFAAHDTASDEGGADMVGAGVVGDGGRGPLRSPVDPQSHDGMENGPLRSPVDPQSHDGGRGPLRSPVESPTHEDEGQEKREHAKPVEVQQTRPRRSRIEERPASTMSTTPTPPAAQGQQTDTPAPKKLELASRAKGAGQPNKTGKQEQPKSQAQIEADALFQSNGESTNRTPQQWLAMLMKAERGGQPDEPSIPEPSPKPAPRDEAPQYGRGEGGEDEGRGTLAVARPSLNADEGRRTLPFAFPLARTTPRPEQENARAEPLSQQTRQFLRPLVGYDPANARVHRSVPAARFAASHNAQAVTTGDDIALATGHQSDTPETLGLLAHELTHVARQHTPGFVPPAANNAPTDEEGVAEQVEQQAVKQAQQNTKQPEHTSHASQTSKQTGNSSQWGGLPAPWEPLPDWLASSPTTTETRGRGSDIDGHRATQPASMDSPSVKSNGNGHAAHMPTVATGTKAAASSGNGGKSGNSANGGHSDNGGGVQRAGNERSMNITAQEVNEPSRGQQQNNTVQEPEPDLDELARQVYTVLKRRLGVERRRMG